MASSEDLFPRNMFQSACIKLNICAGFEFIPENALLGRNYAYFFLFKFLRFLKKEARQNPTF